MRPSQLTGKPRAAFVQAMFTRIAHRYDLMNRLMTAGQDRKWRSTVVRQASIPPHGLVLDLGAGTGDLAQEALKVSGGCTAVAVDFTLAMMRTGQQRLIPTHPPMNWSAADALQLPFTETTFDAVISGFLMRNVGDLPQAIAEQYRVLKPEGRIVILDTTRPKPNLLTPFINFHLKVSIPFLGGLLTGSREAYTYLPDSTQSFLTAEDLADHLENCGFRQVGFQRRMFGTIAIHWGVK